jgi:hypothetical protein
VLFALKQDDAPEKPEDVTLRQFSRDIRRHVNKALETIFRMYQI